jgi:hypothetical protein
MTRTFLVNLLSGIFPLALLILFERMGLLALLWIFVQTACWGCALVLLRWNRDLLSLAIVALAPNALYWVVSIVANSYSISNVKDAVFNLFMEFVLAGASVFLLHHGSALVNVRENQLLNSENPRPQFQLTWLFAVSLFVALAAAIFVYLQKSGRNNPWGLALDFLQLGCWFWIAESLLLPKIRWKSSLALVIAMGYGWYAWRMDRLGSDLHLRSWIPLQIMVVIIPLTYRWAGWRIVPREVAERKAITLAITGVND